MANKISILYLRDRTLKINGNASYIFLIIVQLLLVTGGIAQVNQPTTDKYYVQHFGEEEGLQNSIYSILPDKNGFLWIANSNGLARFNGNRFVPVISNDSTYATAFNNVSSIHYKNDDTLIACSSFSKKVAIIVKNRIVKIEAQQLEKHGLLFWNQKNIIQAPAYITGNYYSSAFGERVKWKTNSFFIIGGTFNKDTLWLAGNDGFWFYDKKGMVSKITIPGIRFEQTTAQGGHILYLDTSNYLNYYTPQGLQKKEFIHIPGRKKLTIVNNGFGEGFYCIADSSLYKFTVSASGKLDFRLLISDIEYPTDVSVILEKDSNTTVIGTLSHGLYIYKKSFFKVSEPLPGGQSNTFFIQQLLPDNQTIFTGSGYLFRNGLYYSKTIKGVDQSFYSIFLDSKGWYWYSVSGQVLRTRSIGTTADTVKNIAGTFVEIFFEDRDGRVWIGSESAFGYFKDTHYTEVKIKELANRKVNCMRQDASGKYYIGTDAGLFILNNVDDTTAKEVLTFKSARVRDIIPEADGFAWIFTYGNGFFLMSKNGITSYSNSTDKLNFVHTMMKDANGNCWLPSDNGLFVTTERALIDFSKRKAEPPFFYKFTIKDGLRTNEFNGGTETADLLLPNGNFSFASMDGLVQFNPLKIPFSFSGSPILIDQILQDSIEVEQKDLFDISPAIKNIHFSIFGSYWGNEENNVLEYQVKTKDATIDKGQWLHIDQSGNINLFAPGHGHYQLIIRKRTGFKAADYLYKTISFYILPRWYQTETFFVVITLAVTGIMIGIFFWRRGYYRRVNRILKGKVDAATIELQLMNNTLEQKVEERTIAIQEAEKRFRTLVEKSLVGVYIVQDGRYVYVNPRYEQLLGYNTGELIGNDAAIIVREDQRDIALENLRKRISGEADSVHYQITGITKDGKEKQLEFFGNAVVYEGKRSIIGTMLDITERTIMERALREAEMKFRDLVEKSLVGVYIIKEGKLSYVNPRFAEIFGYTQQEITEADSLYSIIHEEDRLKVASNIKRRMEGATDDIHYEIRGLKKDGAIIHIEVSCRLTLFEGAKAIIGTLTDITAKKIAQQQLVQEKDLSMSIINNLPGIFYVFDEEGKYLLWNKNYETVTGYTAEEINELPAGTFIIKEELEQVSKTIAKVFSEGYSEAETTLLAKDGRTFSYYYNGVVINYNNKLCMMGVGIDISERKIAQLEREKALKALQKSEANLHTIFDITDIYYVLLDENLKLITFNQSAIDFSERQLEKKFVVNTSFPDYYSENRREDIAANLRTVMSGDPVSYETSYLQTDGSINWYHVRMFPITNQQKDAFGIMIAGTDITETKRMEREILEQKMQEQKTMTRAIILGEERERNKIGQELHDNINQILVGAKLYLSMATRDKSNTENIVTSSIDLLQSAIEEIRILSREKVAPARKKSLFELIETMINNIHATTNIKVNFSYNGNEEPANEDLKINIYRILQEQLNNILKHADARNITIRVEINTTDIIINVQDDGKGFRVKQTSKGIGLSNMTNRVESFNGTINIKSSPGKGCLIEINFPLVTAATGALL